MTVLTYSEILTMLCDNFDSYISPYSIKRTNTNFIYLILKAVAKGYEVINNICVILSYKFDPNNCSDADLKSVALIAGTKFLEGKGSTLVIYATNLSSSGAVTLAAGTYTYAYSADISFSFTISADTSIAASGSLTCIGVASEVGTCEVTQQSSITVTGKDSSGNSLTIDTNIAFSCDDNSDRQGYAAETVAEFRTRILNDQTRSSIVSELQTALRNISTIFDALVYFNNTSSAVTIGSYSVPPYYMLIMLRGTITDEVAEVVASYGIFPTLLVSGGGTVTYQNEVFGSSGYPVHYALFGDTNYSITIEFEYSKSFYPASDVEAKILTALASYRNPVKRTTHITEDIFYSAVKNLNLSSVTPLNITIYDSTGAEVSYISPDKAHIAKLTTVNYVPVEV